MGDEILEIYPAMKVFLEVGNPGQFDVIFEDGDGITKLIYSKDETNRFPEEDEIVKLLGED